MNSGDPIHLISLGAKLAALKDSYFQSVLESLEVMVICHLPDSTITYVNKAFLSFTGLPAEVFIGKKYYDIVPPEHTNILESSLEKITETNPWSRQVIEVQRFDGELRSVLWSSTLVKINDTDQELRVVGLDITDQKKLENELENALEKLKEQEEFFKIIADFTPDMARWVLPDGTLAYISPSCEEITGYTQAEFYANPNLLLDITDTKIDWQSRKLIHDEILDSKQSSVQQFAIKTKSGEKKYLQVTVKPIYDTENRFKGFRSSSRDITRLILAEKSLSNSREEYQQIVDHQDDIICKYNPEGTITFVNETFCRFVGRTAQELTGQTLFEITPPEEHASIRQYLKLYSLQNPKYRHNQLATRPTDGSKVWFDWLNYGIFDQDGNLLEIQGVGRNITKQKELEELTQASEQLYRTIVQQQRDIICRFHPDGSIQYANETALTLFGIPPSRIQEISIFDQVPEKEKPRLVKELNKITPENPSIQVVTEVLYPDGNTGWQHWVATGIYDEQGKLLVIQGIGRDITEMKLVQLKLAQANDELEKFKVRYETVANFTYDLEQWIAPDGTTLYISPSCERITGYKAEEFYAATDFFEKHVLPEDQSLWEKNLYSLEKSTLTTEIEVRIKHKNGQIRWIGTVGQAVYDAEGNYLGIRTSSRDITNRKNTEIVLQKALSEITELQAKLEQENLYLRDRVNPPESRSGVQAHSAQMQEVLKKIGQVAITDSPVLITGETGTGKELIANAIHSQSKRKGKTMIVVNCAALPPSLIESELFGREKGAYTGALAKQVGLFELADQSTLFLDEIGELPTEIQVKLLRILQFGEFQMLGSPHTRKVDVRIIAATNRDLNQAISRGTFRSDLYYRLNVFPIHIPPLRERQEDILPLTWTFIEEVSATIGRRIDKIAKKGIERLYSHFWPGNVRELRNIIEYSLILTKGSTLDIILPTMNHETDSRMKLEDVERRHIKDVLRITHGKIRGVGGAAEILGLNESTLRFRMKKLGIINVK